MISTDNLQRTDFAQRTQVRMIKNISKIEDYLQISLTHSLKPSAGAAAGYSNRCEECGEPIPHARHRILPGCATCVDCANILEQANRIWAKDLGTW